jgi:polyhydroxyalkanoate synthesis regulator protein
MSTPPQPRLVVVKRYARIRLYDTTHSRYVSVEQLRKWVVEGVAFCFIDAEDGAVITRILLA